MILILLLTTLPIILIYLLQKNRKATVRNLLPPGPPGLPLIGNLHQLGSAGSLHVYLWQLSKKYGPIMRLKLGSVPVLVVSSAKLAKEVLKTQDLAFCSRPKLLVPQKLSYNFLDIVFSSYNDHWREVRKITVTHLFSLRKIQSFRPIREDEISHMVTKISGFASSHQVVNFSEFARAVSSTLICRIAFGKTYDDEGSETRRFDELLHEVQTLMATFFVSDYFPTFSWVDKLTGLIDRLDMTCKKLDSFYQELIDEHLDPNRVKNLGEEDFLDVLIQLKEEKSCSVDLTWDHIKALLMLRVTGGDGFCSDFCLNVAWNIRCSGRFWVLGRESVAVDVEGISTRRQPAAGVLKGVQPKVATHIHLSGERGEPSGEGDSSFGGDQR